MFGFFKKILYLLGEDKKKLPLLIFLFICVSILDLAGLGLIGPYVAMIMDPNLMGGLIEKISLTFGLPNNRNYLLITIGILLSFIFLLKAISAIYINYRIISFSQNQQVRLRSHLIQVYQSLPYTEYISRNSSEYLFSIQSLVAQFTNQVVLTSLRTASDIIVATVIISFLAINNLQVLVLLVFLISSLIVVYDRLFRKHLKSYGKISNSSATSMIQGVQEAVDGFKEIRVLGNEGFFHRKVKEGAKSFAKYRTKAQVISSAPRFLLEFLMVSFIVLLIAIMIFTGKDMKLFFPTLAIFGVAALRLLPAANVFSASLTQLRFGQDSVFRLYDDLKKLDEYSYSSDSKNITTTYNSFKKLELFNVSFKYSGSSISALSNISLSIDSGQCIGLMGSSGSGKTTLIDLLLGLLDSYEGQILYNGKPLNESLHKWRSQIAYLPQEVFIIDNSLRCNIALGIDEDKIDEARLSRAVHQAKIDELVDNLPNGLDTILGEGGIRLSGGQRQRVALARAFYYKRAILIMDEATSALDNETEHEIVEEIRQLKGEMTIIVIAHRLSTLQYCDSIHEIRDGQIINSGSFNEMCQK
jgi:ATP-binding cassette, subfamily B, bacterial PglK